MPTRRRFLIGGVAAAIGAALAAFSTPVQAAAPSADEPWVFVNGPLAPLDRDSILPDQPWLVADEALTLDMLKDERVLTLGGEAKVDRFTLAGPPVATQDTWMAHHVLWDGGWGPPERRPRLSVAQRRRLTRGR